MFWGRGDTSKLSEDEQKTLNHIRRMEETGHVVALPPEKSAVAVRGVDFFGQLESVFRVLNSIKNTSMLVGALLAIYWATKGSIVAWIASLVVPGAAP